MTESLTGLPDDPTTSFRALFDYCQTAPTFLDGLLLQRVMSDPALTDSFNAYLADGVDAEWAASYLAFGRGLDEGSAEQQAVVETTRRVMETEGEIAAMQYGPALQSTGLEIFPAAAATLQVRDVPTFRRAIDAAPEVGLFDDEAFRNGLNNIVDVLCSTMSAAVLYERFDDIRAAAGCADDVLSLSVGRLDGSDDEIRSELLDDFDPTGGIRQLLSGSEYDGDLEGIIAKLQELGLGGPTGGGYLERLQLLAAAKRENLLLEWALIDRGGYVEGRLQNGSAIELYGVLRQLVDRVPHSSPFMVRLRLTLLVAVWRAKVATSQEATTTGELDDIAERIRTILPEPPANPDPLLATF